ncbi:Succinylglutamate desuccinylase/aspartoacylase [Marinomonas sp. MED121]|uniref:succinylglutamate desuccinylase/aspartoacylase family protein n=1 Tax=Marinomonas sp. MED121 TaxID=314277 RepID=UPI00006905A9|nr:succinylglutamate desuccinylase/aspartoacylase family protein [Marinomonas sp. MED121]EAQ63655.1 Succinylglutamate desuccinylase/aspartoacylase [Marinomonas sp. MED121]
MSHQILSHILPSATPGSARMIKAHHFGEVGARPKIYLQAGLHADEWPGFLVLNKLIKALTSADEAGLIKGEITIVPVANPIGLAQNFHGYIPGRFAFSDGGGNFNRNWPQLGEKIEHQIKGQISSDTDVNASLIRNAITHELKNLPETTELQGLRKTLLAMSMDADEILDLHCSGEACMHAYVAQEFESHFAPLLARLGANVALSELETGAHSFDETNVSVWRHLKNHYAHLVPWGARSLTLELRGENDISKAQATEDANAIFDYLCERNVIDKPVSEVDTSQLEYFPLDAMDLVKAPCAGIVCYNKKIGDKVEAGEKIGEVVDLMADDVNQSEHALIARTNGIFFARLQRRLVICGEAIGKIAGKEHLAYREIGHLFEDK